MSNRTAVDIYSIEQDDVIRRLILFINTYILLPQILFGCGGNLLNLFVLLSSAMRSRTNLIFASMAFSDLAFLISQIPGFLFYAGPLMNSPSFRSHHYIITAATNWFSAVSIWLMTYATVERVQVISSPFKYCSRSINMRFFSIIAFIWVFAFMVSALHWLCRWDSFPLIQKNIVYVNAILVVIGPLVVCTWHNVKLVNALKSNNRSWTALDDNPRYQASLESRMSTERKVTIVVCVVISCFIVCNCPGALLFVYKTFNNFEKTGTLRFSLLTAISNSMAVTGKVLNFVLFCLSSRHFRNHLRSRCCNFHFVSTASRCSMRSHRTTSIPLEAV